MIRRVIHYAFARQLRKLEPSFLFGPSGRGKKDGTIQDKAVA
jgi:hypothetical protein